MGQIQAVFFASAYFKFYHKVDKFICHGSISNARVLNNMRKKLFYIGALFVGILFTACSTDEVSSPQSMSANHQTYSADALIIQELLEENLSYATSENIEGYLSTISQKGHESTKKAMQEFFEHYDVSHTLLDFEILQEESDEIVVKARQKSEGTSQLDDQDYKNHTAEVLHVFIKERGSWKIKESSITDITFTE